MWLRFMESGVVNTGVNYGYAYELLNNTNNTPVGSNGNSYLRFPVHTEGSNEAHGAVWLFNLGKTERSHVVTHGGYGAQGVGGHGGGYYSREVAVDGIRVTAGSYSFNGGVISLYGVNKV